MATYWRHAELRARYDLSGAPAAAETEVSLQVPAQVLPTPRGHPSNACEQRSQRLAPIGTGPVGQLDTPRIDKRTRMRDRKENAVKNVQDVVIRQFLSHLLDSFDTFEEVFRRFDVDSKRCLSKSEFRHGMEHLRLRSGRTLLETHLDSIFEQIDFSGSNSITQDEIIDAFVPRLVPQQDDDRPMLGRFAKFLSRMSLLPDITVSQTAEEKYAANRRQSPYIKAWGDVQTTPRPTAMPRADKQAIQRLVQLFRSIDLDGDLLIDRDEFESWLRRMRYPAWHLGDLFERLDVDRRGDLDLSKFCVRIEVDLELPPVRQEVKVKRSPRKSQWHTPRKSQWC